MAGEINKKLQQLANTFTPAELAKQAYPYFKQTTPIRSGAARSNTRLRNNEIEADYPYAQRLDEGWSQQAPRGMTAPTVKYIQDWIKRQGGK
jgi:hypothetical protein